MDVFVKHRVWVSVLKKKLEALTKENNSNIICRYARPFMRL